MPTHLLFPMSYGVPPVRLTVIAFLLVVIHFLPMPRVLADSIEAGQTRQAITAFQQGERQGAIRELLKLAYEGNVAAQFILGVIHAGEGSEPMVAEESLYWFRRAAEAGDVSAQFNLGMLLLQSEDDADAASAAQWLQQSAAGGYRPAQINFGILALTRQDFPLPAENGRQWLQQAELEGDPLAGELLAHAVDSAALPTMSDRLHALDTELRSDVRRGANRITRDETAVYALPSGRQEPLLTLNSGDRVEVIRNRQGWVNVRLEEGLPVWVSGDTMALSGRWAEVVPLEAGLWQAPAAPEETYRLGTVNRGERLPVLENEGQWVQVRAPVRFLGWIREGNVDLRVQTVRSGIRANEPQPPKMRPLAVAPGARAAADAIVYRGHSTDASPLGRLLSSARVEEDGETEDRVPLSGSEAVYGWIHGSLVAQESGIGNIQKDRARVRLDPDTTKDNIINLRRRGEAVEVLDGTGEWLRIRLEPVTGWVNGEFVTR